MNDQQRNVSSEEFRQTLREIGTEISKLLEQAFTMAKEGAGDAKSWAAKNVTRDSGSPEGDALDMIERLGALRDKGFITDEEFEQKKVDLLKKVA